MEGMQTSCVGHQRIIAAILAVEPAIAEPATREHVPRCGRGLIRVLENAISARPPWWTLKTAIGTPTRVPKTWLLRASDLLLRDPANAHPRTLP